tara:strand:+ start:4881 stop:5573 length:693 start_codon:yes stop_codon:yes gene_type:complete
MKKTLILFLLLGCGLISQSQNKKGLLKEGNSLYNDSSYNMAEMKYRKSLEKDQNYFNASFNLADAIYKQERFKESSSLFDALKDNAKNDVDLAKINHNHGNSLMKENKTDLAIEAYKNALRQNPKDEDTRYNLAYAQKMKQQEQDQQKDQQKEDKKQDQQKDKQKEDKQQEQQKEDKQQEQQKDQQKKDDMSKEDAEKMLEALEQREKELQEKLQKKKVKGQKIKILKDW